MKKKNRSLGKKILILMMSISVTGLLVTGAVGLLSIGEIHSKVESSNNELSSIISVDSSKSMETKVKEQLKTLSSGIASISDEKLRVIQNHTATVADMASRIYSNPSKYAAKDKGVDYLKKSQVGKFTLHMKTAKTTTKAKVQNELNLLQNVSDMLCQVKNKNFNIGASYIGTETGLQLSADNDPQGPNNRDFPVTDRAWYVGAKNAGKAYWTEVYIDFSNRISITCAVPIYEKHGKKKVLRGVAGSGATLEQVKNIISKAGVGKTGYSFICDEKGNIIIKDGEMAVKDGTIHFDNISTKISDQTQLASKIVSGESGIGEATIDGKDVYLAYSPLSSRPWSMVTVIEKSEALQETQALTDNIHNQTVSTNEKINGIVTQAVILVFVVLFIIILIVVICSFGFARKITIPIQALTDSVKEISGGNLEAEIPKVDTRDEIETLAIAFAKMTRSLLLHIENVERITAEKERIGAELSVATHIQASMLPCIFPPFPERHDVDIFATMEPAKEVGGDFYDFFLVDETHLAVVMADVSGKGVPAALFMVIAKTLIKNNAQFNASPAEIFNTVNAQLCENNEAEMFVTAFCGILDLQTGVFTFSNAGHNFPLVHKTNGGYEWLKSRPNFVLAGMDTVRYKEYVVTFQPGDSIFLYTDGVTEALDSQEELYGDDRLCSILNSEDMGAKSVEGIVHTVREDVRKFVGDAAQADDITMLCMRWLGRVVN